MPHQAEALLRACNSGRFTLPIFWEMRLGKSLFAIRWAAAMPANRILIIAPKSVLSVWQKELQAEGYDCCWLIGTAHQRISLATAGGFRWYLINYEGISRHQAGRKKLVPAPVALLRWECVIVDESVRLKNPKARVTQIATEVFRFTPFKAILSGNPTPESDMNFFCQMRFLDGQFMGYDNFWFWRHTFFKKGWTEWDWQPKKGVLARIHDAVRERAFLLTRHEAGMGETKIYQRRVVSLPPELRKASRIAEKDFELGDRWTKWVPVVRVWLAQLAGGYTTGGEYASPHKVREAMSLLQGELAGELVVVWFRFNRELRAMSKALKRAKIKHSVVTGATSIRQRHIEQARFTCGKAKVLLMQIKCGRYGLDLSASSTAIFFSNSEASDDRRQAEDRLIHPKKNEPLLYVDLVGENTVDEDILDALDDKKLRSNLFMRQVWAKFRARLRRRKR